MDTNVFVCLSRVVPPLKTKYVQSFGRFPPISGRTWLIFLIGIYVIVQYFLSDKQHGLGIVTILWWIENKIMFTLIALSVKLETNKKRSYVREVMTQSCIDIKSFQIFWHFLETLNKQSISKFAARDFTTSVSEYSDIKKLIPKYCRYTKKAIQVKIKTNYLSIHTKQICKVFRKTCETLYEYIKHE